MDTLAESALRNILKMLVGLNVSDYVAAAILDEIEAEAKRGLGIIETPPVITPEQQGGIDETLDALGLGRDDK